MNGEILECANSDASTIQNSSSSKFAGNCHLRDPRLHACTQAMRLRYALRTPSGLRALAHLKRECQSVTDADPVAWSSNNAPTTSKLLARNRQADVQGTTLQAATSPAKSRRHPTEQRRSVTCRSDFFMQLHAGDSSTLTAAKNENSSLAAREHSFIKDSGAELFSFFAAVNVAGAAASSSSANSSDSVASCSHATESASGVSSRGPEPR